MIWSNDMKQTLRDMWLAGETSSKISEALGVVTRNAVMGMVNRMGLISHEDHHKNFKSKSKLSGAALNSKIKVDARKSANLDETSQEEIEQKRIAEVKRIETERVAKAQRIEAERAEAKRIEAKRIEAERAEAERIEAERAEAERIEAERIEAERAEAERAEAERAEAERAEAERIKAQKIASVKAAADRARKQAERVKSAGKTKPVSKPVDTRLSRSYRVSKMPPRPSTAPIVVRDLRLSQGTIAHVFSLADTSAGISGDEAVSFVERLTGQDFNWAVKGHSAALVAIAAILTNGRIQQMLIPKFPEPAVQQVMRKLAINGVIIAGKAPEAWNDPVVGDWLFFNAILKAEEMSDADIQKLTGRMPGKQLQAA